MLQLLHRHGECHVVSREGAGQLPAPLLDQGSLLDHQVATSTNGPLKHGSGPTMSPRAEALPREEREHATRSERPRDGRGSPYEPGEVPGPKERAILRRCTPSRLRYRSWPAA